jgi:predicted esterase
MTTWSRSICIRALAVVAMLQLASCRRSSRETKPPPLPPLTASDSTTLPLSGFGASVVSVPSGATRALPVIVAVLGIGDNPEDQCKAWRDIVGTRAFVLCPRGAPNMVTEEVEDAGAPSEPAEPSDEPSDPPPTPSPSRPDAGRTHQVGFYPVDVASVDREVTVGLAALKARFGAYVADRQVVYAGFSRGAFLGASVAAKHPERFRRVVLIEGGQSAWQASSAAAFARGGAARVLFVCGQPKCVEESEPAAALLRTQRVEARVVHGAGEGHGYKRQVKEELRRSFSWLVEGDPLWDETG